MSCISANISRIGGISAQANRMGGISANVSLVCDIDCGKYLRVEPQGVQWITITTPIDYNVISNIDWMLH